MKTIAIITDFGNKDNFVGVMKAVMLSINPSLRFIDITHQVYPHNIKEAAFILLKSYRFFPRNTIFLVVVDPTVGTKRHPIAIKTNNYYFVGPDNGVLYPAASEDKIKRIALLNRKEFFIKNISSTFHGRDIFAPVAAYLTKKSFTKIGEEIKEIRKLTFPEPYTAKNYLIGNILYIDNFGNIVTNIKKEKLTSFAKNNRFTAYIRKKTIRNFYDAYDKAKVNLPFFIEGSFGYLEVSLNQKRADRYFGITDYSRYPLIRIKRK